MKKVPESIKQEIEKLVKDLNYHCYRYHVLDCPVISDEEYDRLYRRLKELEKRCKYILPESPTQRVGAPPLDKFEKVRHKEPMLSLDNAFSEDDVKEFNRRVKRLLKSDKQVAYTVEPKYDGLAIELTYKKGTFYRALTRGDGYEGEDVTMNIKTIKAVPLKIEGMDVPDEVDIRGEVYMDIKELEALNKEREKQGEPLFANPRNAAAGAIRQLDSSVTASRKLHLACYGMGAARGLDFKTQWDFIMWLEKAHFPIPSGIKLVKGIDKAVTVIKEIEKKRNNFSFETDGAVLKVNEFSLQRLLGVKTREPRWAIAYKFPAHRSTTNILSIEASVGRQGAITPVANLKPVTIGGVTVSRSTLHNWDEIQRKDIRVGDFVEVERAGDVIPHVVAVMTEKRNGREKPYYFERKCSACDSTVIREEGEVAFKCIGLNCSAQAKEKIRNYASKAAMDIEGLGEKNVELLYSEGLVHHFSDIYRLEKEKLLKLPRFAEKSAQNLIDSIERSKKTTLSRFIYSLGINYVGEYSAKLLARKFATIDDLYEVKIQDLKKIEQIGEKVATSVSVFFNDQANINTLKSMKDFGLDLSNPDFRTEKSESEEEKTKKLPFDGLTFVITGTLPKPRTEIEQYIESLGGRTSKSISKNTDYLIAGEKPGSKLKKAKELGVNTISYNELMELSKKQVEEK